MLCDVTYFFLNDISTQFELLNWVASMSTCFSHYLQGCSESLPQNVYVIPIYTLVPEDELVLYATFPLRRLQLSCLAPHRITCLISIRLRSLSQ
jgi:hypothetical protein